MKNFIFASSLIFAMVGCGDEDNPVDDVRDSFNNLVEQPGQQGGWTGPCQSNVFLDLSHKVEYAFIGNQYEKRVLFFEDSSCSTTSATARISGEFTVSERDGENTYNLDSTFTKIELKVSNDSIKSIFEAATFCGQSSYESSEYVDVTDVSGQGACQFGAFPRTEYNVIKVDGNKMYLGSTAIAAVSSEDARPNAVDETTEFTKTF